MAMKLMMFAELLRSYPLEKTAQIVKDTGFDEGISMHSGYESYMDTEEIVN